MEISNLHITEVQIDNYKSLKDSRLELQNGLNIIIGKNGAGKSNMLEFIFFYASRNFFSIGRMNRSLNTNFNVNLEYITNKKTTSLFLRFEKMKRNEATPASDSNLFEMSVNKKVGLAKLGPTQKFIIGDKNSRRTFANNTEYKNEIDVFRGFRRTYIKFQFPDEAFWITKPNRFTVDSSNEVMFPDTNWTISPYDIFDDLELEISYELFEKLPKKIRNNIALFKKHLIKHFDDFLKKKNINEVLNKYSPIKAIRFNPNVNVYSNDDLMIVENLSIDFMIENDWMPWSYLSDGTKRLFYILTEINNRESGLILLEEPELGIHPHQLFKLLGFLKDQSYSKQIIISTHSPMVLDILNDDELDRISIAEFNKGTKFSKLTKKQITKAKAYMKEVGELSYYWLHSDLEK